ncbi:MAG: hypothetical protein WBM32_02655 [Crocosphaera sp.]
MNTIKRDGLTIAVTSYFNPLRYRSRKRNYLLFKSQLSIPLLTIEWSPDGNFELTEQDADFLIKLSSGDLMWQKERLLNIAFSQVPEQFKYIAWLDSDILFLEQDWVKKSEILLKDCYIIQPFSEIFYLDESTTKEFLKNGEFKQNSHLTSSQFKRRYSFIHQYQKLGDQLLKDDLNLRFNNQNSNKLSHQPAYGFAWVARKDFINQHQLYDRAILGGSDILSCYALVNGTKILTETYQSVGWSFYTQNQTFFTWSEKIASVTHNQLSFLQGSLVHLFHGDLKNRQYISRMNGALKYNLDLDQDIVPTDEGLWKFTKKETQASFNDYFYNYLQSRRED